jgi:hypothetical protein
MKSMGQAQNITIGLQAAALHSTYNKSVITEACNSNDHTRFKPVTSACRPHAYEEFDMQSIQPACCTCLTSRKTELLTNTSL